MDRRYLIDKKCLDLTTTGGPAMKSEIGADYVSHEAQRAGTHQDLNHVAETDSRHKPRLAASGTTKHAN